MSSLIYFRIFLSSRRFRNKFGMTSIRLYIDLKFMKYIFIFLITLYQYTLSPIFRVVLGAHCRYEKTCSVYAKEKIKEFGIIKGGKLAISRLLSCNPFGTIHQ